MKFDGLYNDPNDCTAYYQCFRGSTSKSHCPKGQLFNAIIKTCDNPMNFPCEQRRVMKSAPSRNEKETNTTANAVKQKDKSFEQKGMPAFFVDK